MTGVLADNKIIASIKSSFFSYGFLLPATLPLMYILGRAPYNILGAIYFLWGLVAVISQPPKIKPVVKLLFFILYLSFLLSAPFAEDPNRAFRSWAIFVLNSQVFFFSLAVFQQKQEALDKLIKLIAVTALFAPVVLFVKAGLMTGEWGRLIAPRSWQETSLPFLALFLMWWVWVSFSRAKAVFLCVAVFVSTGGYIVAADSRASLVSLLVTGVVFCVLFFRVKWQTTLLIALLIIIPASFFVGKNLMVRQEHKLSGSALEVLDSVSSNRTGFWQRAIQYPPENPVIGVGMGNVRYREKIITSRSGEKAKHLHNFILDTWYETGFFGLGSLLFLFGYFLLPARWLLRADDQRIQMYSGLLLSSVVAILVAGLFSISYTSPHFKMYLFLFFACLTSLQQEYNKVSDEL